MTSASNSPYRIRLVDTPQGFAQMTMDLWILERLADRTERILRAPDGPSGGLWEPTPAPGAVWDVPPTLQLPTDLLPALRAEIDRILTGRPLASADVQAARADTLAETLRVERSRVDRILTSLLDLKD